MEPGDKCLQIFDFCVLPSAVGQVVSLDLCGSHLLLGIAERKGAFHMSGARLSVSHFVSEGAPVSRITS